MKNEELFSAILDKELTPESKNKLKRLSELLKNQQINEHLSLLQESIKGNENVRFIFEYACKSQSDVTDAVLKDYISTNQLMKALHISRRTLASWRALGILEGRKYRNTYYFSIRKIVALLMENYNGNKTM